MKKSYGVNELRRMYLSFFESKEHLAMKSFSLVPHNDNSLLLINAGMIMKDAWRSVAEGGEGKIYDEMKVAFGNAFYKDTDVVAVRYPRGHLARASPDPMRGISPLAR